jgi:glycosyltransferase involved in cell wall biosynthesis
MKILFLTTDDSTFWSHRLALAREAKNEGAEVVIMTAVGKFCSRLEKEGFRVIPWNISRRSMSPLRELRSLLEVIQAYRSEQPDLVHHVALKPIVHGSIAARLQNDIPAANTITGLGPVFMNSNLRMALLRLLLTTILKRVLKTSNCRVICQNEADKDLLIERGISLREKTVLIPGFGVDINRFVPLPEPAGITVVMLPARILWEKGIREFVAAAEELRSRNVPVRMVLVGAPDENNPGCVPKEQIEAWVRSGAIEWWGHIEDMPSVLCQSHIVCLPSYGEGLPKILLEAAACARPIVTTCVSGCSAVVDHGVNGLLIPVKDAPAIVAAVLTLAKDRDLRERMGAEGRARIVRDFSDAQSSRKIIAVYLELLDFRSRTRNSFSESRAGSKRKLYFTHL